MRHRQIQGWLLTLICCSGGVVHGASPTILVELEVGGRRLEGAPLAWSASDVLLLARDGRLHNFHPGEARNYRKKSDHFVSYSSGDMRSQLKSEFGKGFEVSQTGHYLVVHPRGQREVWARRFEELYRSYLKYFTARGFEPRRPEFPLVAVAFPNQREFLSYAQQSGAKLVTNTLGYYSPQTNRILLYDVTGGNQDDPNWQINAETIVHEAIHQMAFNSGVHSRFAPPPRWVAEGLGTLFEARGVANADRYIKQSERINQHRLADFRNYCTAGRETGSLAGFLASDRSFQTSPEAAYSEAWALTFFLFETQPARYVDYLQHTARRAEFTDYRATDRLTDFQRYFGADLRQLETRFLRYMAGLK